ncbi:MAG TPA: LemA family protein [Alphaproteobacteria bacterium]|nr:LemA family protein [Alphaproteobacteria bacterium]HOO50015.1 LemA family protein [Alphaproteobacteria bacterium]
MGSLSLFVIGIIAIIIVAYNRIAALFQRRKNAFADIDVQLEQRYNTIPNMVEVVKGYAGHEHRVFKDVVAARTAIKDAYGVGENRFKAEAQMTRAVRQLFALVENYPELKSDQNFLYLQNELSELENKISASRRFFNSTTAEYNTAIQQFPGNFLARIFGFLEEPFFKIEGEKEAQKREVPAFDMNSKG